MVIRGDEDFQQISDFPSAIAEQDASFHANSCVNRVDDKFFPKCVFHRLSPSYDLVQSSYVRDLLRTSRRVVNELQATGVRSFDPHFYDADWSVCCPPCSAILSGLDADDFPRRILGVEIETQIIHKPRIELQTPSMEVGPRRKLKLIMVPRRHPNIEDIPDRPPAGVERNGLDRVDRVGIDVPGQQFRARLPSAGESPFENSKRR